MFLGHPEASSLRCLHRLLLEGASRIHRQLQHQYLALQQVGVLYLPLDMHEDSFGLLWLRRLLELQEVYCCRLGQQDHPHQGLPLKEYWLWISAMLQSYT